MATLSHYCTIALSRVVPLLFHLSDLHFGPKFNEHLAELVLKDILNAKPDLTIISGDFTMRAQIDEYERARDYVERIPRPVFVIPGNHDQPLSWDTAWERLTTPWARYTRHFGGMSGANVGVTDAKFEMPGVFILGVNDNHPLIPGGIWSREQHAWMNSEFSNAPKDACKVLVMHHQISCNGRLRPFGHWFPTAHLNWLSQLGVELILNGHTHIPLLVRSAQGIVIAQSGTTMSTRVRHGHGNTYNQITIAPDALTIQVMGYDENQDRFLMRDIKSFPRRTHLQERHA